VAKAVERANAGDGVLIKFLLEQIYGKAPQPLTNPDGGLAAPVSRAGTQGPTRGRNWKFRVRDLFPG
jgi:hypothetical protein